jgi:hypothetical protein
MRPVILVLLMLCLPVAAGAEKFQSSWFVYANANTAIPSSPGEFNSLWKSSIAGGLGGGLQVSPWVTVVAHVDADLFKLDDGKAAEANGWESADGGTISIVHAWIGGRAHTSYPDPLAKFKPYLTGGIGIIRNRYGRIDYVSGGMKDEVTTTTEIAFAANAGFGSDYQITDNLRGWIDVQAVLGLTDPDDTVYFPLRFGLSYRIGAGPYF